MPQRLNPREYSVEEAIEGGMARVLKARHLPTGEFRAIKVLKDCYADKKLYVERFHQEAAITRSLSHRNIVKVYDEDCTVNGPDHRTHFFVMEFVDGKDLQRIIQESAPLPRDQIVAIISQLCDALHYAHTFAREPVIHRDIKPSNILVESKTGRVVLTDFGIACSRQGPSRDNLLIGTAEYMSPEHARNAALDPRSDLYSVGVIMYEMATGRAPFAAGPKEGPHDVLEKHLSEPPTPPSVHNPRISRSLEAIILLLLEKSPDQRYQSAAQLKAHLEGQWTTPAGVVPITQIQREARGGRKFPSFVAFLLVLLLVFVGYAAFETYKLITDEKIYTESYTRAKQALAAQDWRTTLEFVRKAQAIRSSPALERMASEAKSLQHAALGRKLEQEGKIQEAIDEYDRSLQLIPREEIAKRVKSLRETLAFEATCAKVERLASERKWSEAIGLAEKALASHPNDQRLLTIIRECHRQEALEEADVKEQAGDLLGALTALNKSLAFGEDKVVRRRIETVEKRLNAKKTVKRIRTLIAKGDLDGARKALAELPAEDYAAEIAAFQKEIKGTELLDKARQAAKQQQWTEAKTLAEQSLKLMPSEEATSFVKRMQARLLVEEGDKAAKKKEWDRAVIKYAAAYQIQPTDELQKKLEQAQRKNAFSQTLAKAREAMAKKEWDLALAALQTVRDEDADGVVPKLIAEVEGHRLLDSAKQAAKENNTEKAESVLQKLLATQPSEPLRREAEELLQNIQYQKELASARDAIKEKQWTAAQEALERAAAIRDSKEIQDALREVKARLLEQQGDAAADKNNWPAAVGFYARALKRKDLPSVRDKLAQARRELEYQTELALGTEAVRVKDFEKARTHFERALQIKSSEEVKKLLLDVAYGEALRDGDRYMEQKEYKKAMDAYNRALSVKKTDEAKQRLAEAEFQYWGGLAEKFDKEGKETDAIDAYKKALRARGHDYTDADLVKLAQASRVKKEEQRRAQFETHMDRARQLEKEGKWLDAFLEYRRAQEFAEDKEAIEEDIKRCTRELINSRKEPKP